MRIFFCKKICKARVKAIPSTKNKNGRQTKTRAQPFLSKDIHSHIPSTERIPELVESFVSPERPALTSTLKISAMVGQTRTLITANYPFTSNSYSIRNLASRVLIGLQGKIRRQFFPILLKHDAGKST